MKKFSLRIEECNFDKSKYNFFICNNWNKYLSYLFHNYINKKNLLNLVINISFKQKELNNRYIAFNFLFNKINKINLIKI